MAIRPLNYRVLGDENLARLPNAERAIIEADKLRGYVLSSAHPVGRFKAAFFQRLGYSAENWEAFEWSLRELILSQDVAQVEESQYGQKFIVEGPFKGSSGETRRCKLSRYGLYLKGRARQDLLRLTPEEGCGEI
jgi:hypothetical protein